ncbi:hypothetical protein F4808DRAFT_474037 [Astrocystis sublimbata]|nr:hypothetical protein F4808DRAFT_474037 [Astrocystis sublimbata]
MTGASTAATTSAAGGGGDLGLFDHYIAKRGTKIEVFIKVQEVDTAMRLDKSKTIGTMTTRNNGAILMSAHSGYTTRPNREEKCLDTNKWNYIAHHIARQIRFRFRKTIRDAAGMPVAEEHRGRAHAGHVEVLLASWMLLHLLREDIDLIDKPDQFLAKQLRRLRDKSLGDRRTVFITIDSEPCPTCLQFLNRLSEYTRMIFVVFGSRGVGPIQVRIDGQRRLDVVGEVFVDSENEDYVDEGPDQSPIEKPQECPPVPADNIVEIPATPAQSQRPRRPASSWGKPKATQWTPENPEKLLSSYKRKTPVFEFPGYNKKSKSSPAIHIEDDSDTEDNSGTENGLDTENGRVTEKSIETENSHQSDNGPEIQYHPAVDESGFEIQYHPAVDENGFQIEYYPAEIDYCPAEVEIEDDSDWEDVGDGIMMSSKDIKGASHEDPLKVEDACPTPPIPTVEPEPTTTTNTAYSSGNIFARAAYDTIRERSGFEVVERPWDKIQNPTRRARNYRSVSSPTSNRPLHRSAHFANPVLERFRHDAPENRDESIFRSRYAILGTELGRFQYD